MTYTRINLWSTCSLGILSATEMILSHCDFSAPDYLPSHNIQCFQNTIRANVVVLTYTILYQLILDLSVGTSI